jgi:hypothetical protein
MSEVCDNPSLPETNLIAFEVTEVDVLWGLRKSASKCVVAKALERSFPDKTVRVYDKKVLVYSYGDGDVRSEQYETAPELERQIDRFDEDGDFAVGWYTINR